LVKKRVEIDPGGRWIIAEKKAFAVLDLRERLRKRKITARFGHTFAPKERKKREQKCGRVGAAVAAEK